MSHLMTALAMRQKGLKPATKIVLYWLADHHNSETGDCFPSMGKLAEECEMNRSTVQEHLKKLEAAGLIQRIARTRENGSKTSNAYALILQDGGNSANGWRKNRQGHGGNSANHNLGSNNPLEPDGSKVPVTGEADLFAADAEDQKQRRNPEAQKLPFSWVPSEADKTYALKQGLTDQEISEIAEAFLVYFTEGKRKNDKRTFKGWQQSWQGWVRREKSTYVRNRRLDARGNGLPNRGPASISDALRELGEQAKDQQ